MDTLTPSITTVFAERLTDLGITNGGRLARYTGAPAVIYFLAKDDAGGNDPRAEIHDLRHKETQVRVIRPKDTDQPIGVLREETVAKAIAQAKRRFKRNDWRKAPFGNCWVPVEALNRVRMELGIDPLM
jgi:hypothetical protein